MSKTVFAYEFKKLPKHLLPESSGPLVAQRLAVKDVIHIEGVPTGAGNPDWLATQQLPVTTSPVIVKLIEAGAELIAKTQTDELACSFYGHNMHYGIPTNPMAPDCLPGGSSSGSAVAVASGLADIGVGTDTIGAVRIPASFCGLFGYRPTYALISMQDVLPLAPSFDTIGWMTRDFDTLYKVSDVLLSSIDQLEQQEKQAPKNLRIFRPESLSDNDWEQLWSFIEPSLSSVFETVDIQVWSSSWLSELYGNFRVLHGREVWRSYGEWYEHTKPLVAKDLAQRIEYSQSLSADDELAASKNLEAFGATLNEALPDASWCGLLPTTPGASPPVLDVVTGDFDPDVHSAYDLKQLRDDMLSFCTPASLMGWPQLSLPISEHDAAPWGVSLLGRAHQDIVLLEIAKQLMQSIET